MFALFSTPPVFGGLTLKGRAQLKGRVAANPQVEGVCYSSVWSQSTPDTYTYTVPANCTSITITVWGAGAGGGGVGGTATDGNPGAQSTANATIVANGGDGGIKGAAGAGGNGGTASGGDTNQTGGNGSAGVGGTSGAGGSAYLGGAGGASVTSGSTAGNAGNPPGGGGSGGRITTGGGQSGGGGGAGGYARKTLTVTSSQQITVVVGAGGPGGTGTAAGGAGSNGRVLITTTGAPPLDTCLTESPAIGTTCTTGAIFAGTFDGGTYMTLPGGCDGSTSNPMCSGTDTMNRTWRGSAGSDADIAGITNIGTEAEPSPSSERGHVTTPLIVAHASTSSDSAAHYCDEMDFGGYTDWYLPSKSELAYIYCKAEIIGGSHNTNNPQENVNCASLGGKTSQIPGWATTNYWVSTEYTLTSYAWGQNFSTGLQSIFTRGSSYRVRCVRRF